MPIVFRPPRIVRLCAALMGGISMLAALLALGSFISSHDRRMLIEILVMMFPSAISAAATRRAVIVREEGLQSVSLFRSQLIPWNEVHRLDQTRVSFVAETARGPVSAGWLARGDRDRLMRLIMEKARLIISSGHPRWGLIAQYVPRARTIPLQSISPNRPDKSE